MGFDYQYIVVSVRNNPREEQPNPLILSHEPYLPARTSEQHANQLKYANTTVHDYGKW